MSIYYHTEGARAFLLEQDGTTICEIVAPSGNNRAEIAKRIVSEFNGAEFLRVSLKAENDRLERNERLEKECADLRAQLASATAECTRSHPHEIMTPMCELRTEIARLGNQNRNLELQLAEEIRISNERGQHIEQRWAEIAALSQDLAAATKRIEEAENQEPVARFQLVGNEYQQVTSDAKYIAEMNIDMSDTFPLYPRPTPPADVAELQRQYGRLDEIASEAADMNNRQALRIAELERKLAEQQAKYKKLHNAFSSVWVVIPQQTFFAQKQIELANALLASEMESEELNKLLSEALEEGRKEAGWISTKEKMHPDKPGLMPYEQIQCLIVRNNEILLRQWNCEHLVWDTEDGDDFYCNANDVTHWMPLPAAPSPALNAKEGGE